jgi:hypothetical protein
VAREDRAQRTRLIVDSPRSDVAGWRQRGLPGVNAPLAPGGVAPKRLPPGLAKLLRVFDNTKDYAALAPHGETADAWFQAAIVQLCDQYGPCGAIELGILRGAAEQMFWSQVFFDRARTTMGAEEAEDKKLGMSVPKLVETASRITDSCRASVVAASSLRAARAQQEAATKPPVNPLATFDLPEPEGT